MNAEFGGGNVSEHITAEIDFKKLYAAMPESVYLPLKYISRSFPVSYIFYHHLSSSMSVYISYRQNNPSIGKL